MSNNSNRDDRRGYNCHMNDNESTNRSGSRGDHNNRRRDYDRMSSSNRNRSMSDADIERNDNKRYRRGDFKFNDIFLNMT